MHRVDRYFSAQEGSFYARYRDDFLVFTRRRWQLRRCVKGLHAFFNLSGFETHPVKTQLGRIEQDVDWLGVQFSTTGTTIAPQALENHRAQRVRLYDQARRQGLPVAETEARVRAYEARWVLWTERMLTGSISL
ncbi:reverse transcriptase domain-containing protein [Serratia proteamaculans]|uniref:reverse transcriptase domain-containing protein n=1 Tax=Serratia proteamaculans TaxID=28151 RepID=UPI0021BB7E5E|nr:reverse transcriptase domain-containing protein [Serratia proteamaculans]